MINTNEYRKKDGHMWVINTDEYWKKWYQTSVGEKGYQYRRVLKKVIDVDKQRDTNTY